MQNEESHFTKVAYDQGKSQSKGNRKLPVFSYIKSSNNINGLKLAILDIAGEKRDSRHCVLENLEISTFWH